MEMRNFLSKTQTFFKQFLPSGIWRKIIFLVTGIISTSWFIIRVIPKPTRATYPCMKAAAPVMSGFIVYLLSITGSAFAFKKMKNKLAHAKYLAAGAIGIVAIVMIVIANVSTGYKAKAINKLSITHFEANKPIGTACGSKPGRVVWVWDPDATDENLVAKNDENNYWANFTNKDVVDLMLQKAITGYTDISSIPAAWDALFKYFNNQHGKGEVGYKPGEKIYIKINLTNSCCDLSGYKRIDNFNHMDNTPELLLALLKELIEDVGVDQSDIYLGDPFRRFHDLFWDMLHTAYPNVIYCDNLGASGRNQTVPTDEDIMIFSDGVNQCRLPQEIVDSDYLINVPCLKTHDTGGITLGAKNFQGTILQDGAGPDNQSAMLMHYSLPANDNATTGNHRYRHLVDYMGHEQLGGKVLVTILDGIWAGKSWQGYVEKWAMTPFNGDYPSSIFISQDKVAIDAVGFDFLLEEYKNKTDKALYCYMPGVDDYLYQAADPSYWADGIMYDPEGDGTTIGSLGVYEHWNNAADKKYSRNLGTGNGIELISFTKREVLSSPSIADISKNICSKIYPNPAKNDVFIEYTLKEAQHVTGTIYDISGRKVIELFNKDEFQGTYYYPWNVERLHSGQYILKITTSTNTTKDESINRFRVCK